MGGLSQLGLFGGIAKLLASLGAEVPMVTKVRCGGSLGDGEADARAIHHVSADGRVVQLEHHVGAALDELGGVELARSSA